VVQRVDTADVQRLASEGAQLVEVLPADAFEREHLPGARSIPMPELDERGVAGLDREAPVVTYCYDHECDLSARAAARLEALGFCDVYDYVASKVAWLANGLPVEGTIAASSRAGSIAHDAPTCGWHETVADLEGRFTEGARLCVVVDERRVVLGVVRPEVRDLPSETPLAHVTQPAPPSVRPSVTARELARSMDDDHRTYVLVTKLDGELLGVIDRSDLNGRH
jgi:rhodanese-related sulfurtransferase/CBS domain-containing protein